MPKTAHRKVKWTLSLDPVLQRLVVNAARKSGVHPVTVLEDLVREKLNPFGYSNVNDSVAYVTALRKQSRKQSEEAFLAEIDAWQKSRSS
jgi:hypothetical protein